MRYGLQQGDELKVLFVPVLRVKNWFYFHYDENIPWISVSQNSYPECEKCRVLLSLSDPQLWPLLTVQLYCLQSGCTLNSISTG